MDRKTLSIAGVVLATLAVGAVLYFDTPSGNDERDRLIGELQAFGEFAEHEALLMAVVEEAHDDVVERNIDRRPGGWRTVKVLDWDGYRAEMYMKLRNAVAEAGHPETALRLDQHRARQ